MEQEYEDAYNEVLEVLKYIPKEDYEKIPKKIISLFENYRNEKNSFQYNAGVSFDKQGLSQNAKIILSIIYRSCWATEKEKNDIAKREKQRLKYIDIEKRKKYNVNEIFNNKNEKFIKGLQENNYSIVKEKWYHKLIRRILHVKKE